jgi:hypothetical protein
MADKLLKELLQTLPRCIKGARLGITNRCPRVGLYVLENEKGERDYGAPLCREHANYFAPKDDSTVRMLRYGPAAEKLAKREGVELETNDRAAYGVAECKTTTT